MLVVTSNLKKEIDAQVLSIALDILRAGGVIAYATDTCYGFSCDTTNKSAVDRLRYLKKMPSEKPISLMFSDPDMVIKWVDLDQKALRLVASHWPGQLTMVARKKNTAQLGMMDYANRGLQTLGCRIPACVFSHNLINVLAKPITSTSANFSGLPQTYSGVELIKQYEFADLKPDLIIDSGVQPKINPSTIVDVSGPEYRIIRKGEVVLQLGELSFSRSVYEVGS